MLRNIGLLLQMNDLWKKSRDSKLSDRWRKPERDGILCGKMGYGDVSSWAKGTTQASRPIVGRIPLAFTPVRNLGNCVLSKVTGKPHNPDDVILPHESRLTPDACDIDKTFKIQKNFWKLLGHKDMDVRPKA